MAKVMKAIRVATPAKKTPTVMKAIRVATPAKKTLTAKGAPTTKTSTTKNTKTATEKTTSSAKKATATTKKKASVKSIDFDDKPTVAKLSSWKGMEGYQISSFKRWCFIGGHPTSSVLPLVMKIAKKSLKTVDKTGKVFEESKKLENERDALVIACKTASSPKRFYEMSKKLIAYEGAVNVMAIRENGGRPENIHIEYSFNSYDIGKRYGYIDRF